MKMKTGFLAALALFFMALSSCGNDADEDIFAPTNTWVYKDLTYGAHGQEASSLRCYLLFSRGGYKISDLANLPKSSKSEDQDQLKPGLTVVIVPSSSSERGALTEILGNQYFICKSFALNEETDGDDGFRFKMTEAKWNVFYIANVKSLYPTQTSRAPKELSTTGYSEISGITGDAADAAERARENFSWKKLLLEILLMT